MSANTSRWNRLQTNTVGRYAIALGVTALSLLIRGLLDPLLGDFAPYFTFYPGLAFLAMFVGMGPSIVSAILGMLGTTYWFIPPRGSFEIRQPAHFYGNLTFLMVCACVIAAGEVSRRWRTKLQRTQMLFETFLDHSPGAEFLKDEEGRYLYANQTARTLFGKFTGETDSELFPGKFPQQWRRNDLQVLRENKALEFNENTEGPDGERTWRSVKFPVIDAEGRTLLGAKSFDITEQRRTEEEMRAAAAQLRGFLETVPTGLTRCSRDLRYVVVNPAYAQMAGLAAEQIAGRPIVDVMGADAWEKIRPYVERVLSGERVEYETLLPYSAGGARHVQVVYTPEMDSNHKVAGWVASVTDITEIKRVEEQLRKVEKLAAAGQLAASLAHEINNPLSAVMNVLYLLETRPDLDAGTSSLVKTAASELERVARIVRQSLAYYRVGTAPKELDLGASLEESLQVFGEKFQRSSIQVSKKITSTTLMMGFPDEIRQVIDNLLLNALEATPSGGRVAVSVRWSRDWKNRDQGGVRFTIGDSGSGVPKDQFAKIFEPFFTTKAEGGTGLGLWVVRGIVAKHDARMKFRSAAREGKSGTVVSILWPCSGWREHKDKAGRSESAA